jgi:hypothetical protein
VPFGLQRKQFGDGNRRHVCSEFSVTLKYVDHDAFGVQPIGERSRVDRVRGLPERPALVMSRVGLLGDVFAISTHGTDSVGVGDRAVTTSFRRFCRST